MLAFDLSSIEELEVMENFDFISGKYMSKKSSHHGKNLSIDEMLAVNDSSPYIGEVDGGVLLTELYAFHDTHLFEPRCGKVLVLTKLG